MAGLVDVSIGKSALIQLANFLLLLFLLNQFLFKPIIRFLESRQGTIHGNREAAREKEQEAEELLRGYLEGIEGANREASESLSAVRREAEVRQREMMEEARERAGDMLSQATAEIKQAAETARGKLREEAGRVSRDIAEKLLGRSLA